jgi:hypothetical protein
LPAPLEASNLEAGGQAETAAQNTQIVVNGGMVNIVYDLSGPSTQTFDVALEISEDGGRTYALKPRNVHRRRWLRCRGGHGQAHRVGCREGY